MLQADNFDSFCDPELEDCELECICDEDASDCECEEIEEDNDTVPAWMRQSAQITSAVFEMHVVVLAIFPWWLLGIMVIFTDFLIDGFWWLLFNWFCDICAYIFVWIFNIAMLPFHMMFWYQRVHLELVGFLFDGWLLFMGWDGCFLRWGQHCWFAKRINEKGPYGYMDLVWLTLSNPGAILTDTASWGNA